MTVLFLGRPDSGVLAHLREQQEQVVAREEPLTASDLQTLPDFVVSHGYRHIVRRDVLELLPDRAVNLHISYLPWNRGADPTLWSYLDETPRGVTIHYMDEGVDTGDIIAQRLVRIPDDATLATAYAALQCDLLELFVERWPSIRAGTCDRLPQPAEGTVHRVRDRAAVEHLLVEGWNTPVAALRL
jgi:methionyl-tRNA formyltransferase